MDSKWHRESVKLMREGDAGLWIGAYADYMLYAYANLLNTATEHEVHYTSYHNEDFVNMTTKKKKAEGVKDAPTTKTPWREVQYVKVPLEEHHKDNVIALADDHPAVVARLIKTLEAGYRVNLKRDPKTGIFTCLVDGDFTWANRAYVLESRGRRGDLVLASALYKVVDIYKMDSWKSQMLDDDWLE